MARRRFTSKGAFAALSLVAVVIAACQLPASSPTACPKTGSSASRALSSASGTVALVSPDKKGRLIVIDEATKKQLVHLEGSAYAMGYQHGYLLAEEVKNTCSLDFFRAIAMDFLGSDETLASVIGNDALFSAIIGTLEAICLTQAIYATEDMRQEMRGLADGARKRLAELGVSAGEVSYERIVLTNQAFDVILSYVYPIIVSQYLSEDQKAKVDASAVVAKMHMCDGFVATGSATATGGTIMTRSFMISDVIGTRTVLMEYSPSSGYKFVAANIPGFVGTPCAMNQCGVSIGMDMVPALKANGVAPGMGCLLTSRYVMQYESSAADALAAIRNSVARGVPWIYIVADPGTGAIAEAAATTGLGWMPDQARYFAARSVDYSFDASRYPQAGIDQIETRPDLVLASNHFIDPAIRQASGSYAVKESTARYDYLAPRILEAIAAGLDVARAEELVNYLSPLASNPYGNDVMANPFGEGKARVGDYYAGKEKVHGLRAVFENGTKKLHILYGTWADPWVDYALPY